MSEQHPPATKSGFHQAASFVERALSFRTNTQRATSSSSTAGNDASSSSQQQAPIKPLIKAPLTAKDLKETEVFPHVAETHIEKLLPGEDLEHARQWVQAALQEMHLNYDLDPKLLGERSDANRGNALIALLLSRITLPSPKDADSEHERGKDTSLEPSLINNLAATRHRPPPKHQRPSLQVKVHLESTRHTTCSKQSTKRTSKPSSLSAMPTLTSFSTSPKVEARPPRIPPQHHRLEGRPTLLSATPSRWVKAGRVSPSYS